MRGDGKGMKKVLQIVAAFGFMAAVFSGTVAAAEPKCSIETTGTGSNNVCVTVEEVSCVVVNNNEITVNNTNYQVSDTGDATVTGNTGGGGASTGDSSNSSSSSFNIQVVNDAADDDDLCLLTTTTRTPVPSASQTEEQSAVNAPAMLPKTSGNTVLSYVGLGLMVVIAVAVVTRLFAIAQNARK